MSERTGARAIAIVAAGLFMGALFMPARAGAIEVKKELYTGHGGAAVSTRRPEPRNPLTPALRKQLAETVSYESEKYLDAESEKKAEGKDYVDIEHARFIYLPKSEGGKVSVTAKLEAAEYKGHKGSEKRGRATGKRKVLIFNYRLDGKKWTEAEPPKWEDVTAKKSAKAR